MYLDRIALETWAATPALRGATRLPNVDRAALPTSRYFRNCWRWDGNRVQTDLALAKAQRLAEIREERNRRLAASDGERARLEEIGTPQQRTALAQYRQRLRDIPLTVEADFAVWLAPADDLERYQPPWPAPPA